MAFDIHLMPDKVWGFFNQNKDRLKDEMVEIAENQKSSVSVYLTEENTLPCVMVYRKDNLEYKEGCVSDKDTITTVQKIYAKYLPSDDVEDNVVDRHLTTYNADDPADYLEFMEISAERDDEIFAAFQDFLLVLVENVTTVGDFMCDSDKVNEAVEYILDYLASEHGFHIYRPMAVFDDDEQAEVLCEYPYDMYDFSASEKTDK